MHTCICETIVRSERFRSCRTAILCVSSSFQNSYGFYLKCWLMPIIMQIGIMFNVFYSMWCQSHAYIVSNIWARFLLYNFFLIFFASLNNYLYRLIDTFNSKIIFIMIKMSKTGYVCLTSYLVKNKNDKNNLDISNETFPLPLFWQFDPLYSAEQLHLNFPSSFIHFPSCRQTTSSQLLTTALSEKEIQFIFFPSCGYWGWVDKWKVIITAPAILLQHPGVKCRTGKM